MWEHLGGSRRVPAVAASIPAASGRVLDASHSALQERRPHIGATGARMIGQGHPSIDELGSRLRSLGPADVRLLIRGTAEGLSMVTGVVNAGQDLAEFAEGTYDYGDVLFVKAVVDGDDLAGWLAEESGEVDGLTFCGMVRSRGVCSAALCAGETTRTCTMAAITSNGFAEANYIVSGDPPDPPTATPTPPPTTGGTYTIETSCWWDVTAACTSGGNRQRQAPPSVLVPPMPSPTSLGR